MRFTTACLALTLAVLAAPLPCRADDTGGYLTADAARVVSSLGRSGLNTALSSALYAQTQRNTAITSSSADHSAWAWSAAAGYRLARCIGVEAGWLDLGDIRYAAAGTQHRLTGPLALQFGLHVRSHGPTLGLRGALALLPGLALYGRLGAYQGKTISRWESFALGKSNSGADSKTSTALLAGAGAGYALTGHLELRVEFLHVHRVKEATLDPDRFNVNLGTAGLSYAF